jgi:hypothetical protein
MTIEPVATVSWDEIAQLNLPKAPPPPPGHKTPPPRARIDMNSLPAGGRVDVQAVQRTEQKGFEVNAILPFNMNYGSLEDNGATRPPDTNGAVGISHVMTMLNSEVRIQTKNGGIVSTVPLNDFWNPAGGDAPFDPKLVYDQGSDRWLATCDADRRSAASSILFAISATSNPLGNWTFYRIDVDPGGDSWADFPDLGFNNTWIGITNNIFTVSGDNFEHVDVRVINKASALAGGALTVKKFELENNEFSVRVCHTFGSQSALYMIDNWSTSPQDLPIYRMFAVTGNPVNPNLEVVNWSIPATTNPNFDYNPTLIDATQLGTGVKLQTNDTRLLNAVYRGGYIYTVHHAGYPLTGTPNRTELRWFAFSPITGSGFGDYMGGGPGSHWLYPTITVNAASDCIIGFTRSDASRYAEACYMVRDGTPFTNDFGPVQVFKSGEGPYDHGNPSRWGDYSSCSVDPVDDTSFWTIQEYAESGNRWGTWWVSNADLDTDDDGILDDGDFSSIAGDAPCSGGNTQNCDDNCVAVQNAGQEDCNSNGVGDICDPNYLVVGSTLPAPYAIGSTDPVVTISFCEPMSAASLTTASVIVRGAREGPIAGSVTPVGATAYFVPSVPFPKNEPITVTLTSAIACADGAPDFGGHTLSFTTAGCSRAVFQPEVDHPSSPEPLSALTADFNGDGTSDVVTAGAGGTVSLLLNNGAGGFPSTTNLALGSNQGATKPMAGDVDADGDLDLGIVCWLSGTFLIMTNNGTGAFTVAYTHAIPDITGGADMADIDADGDLDFVVSVGGANDAIKILFNNGQGAISSSITISALNAPGRPHAADLNNDGWLDVVVGSVNGGAFSVFLNDREGGFTRSDFGSINPRDLDVADFNGDGDLDVAVHSSPDETVQVFVNNGLGGFTLGSTVHPVSGWAIVPADLDSDGDLDLATATHSPTQLAWAENDGTGAFTLHQSLGGSRSGADIAILDADLDGSIDVAIANQDEHTISVVLNAGPPAAPLLTSPPNGHTTAPPATPLLNCEDVQSALYYRFMIDDDSNFGSPIHSGPFMPTSQWTVTPALGAGTYHWRAAAINACGLGAWSASRTLVVQGSGGGGGCQKQCPTESGLIAQGVDSGIFAVLPNPFRSTVDVHFAVAQAVEPEIRVFDLQGREVHADRLAEHPPGRWKWSWAGMGADGSRVSSGIYFVRVRLGAEQYTRRIVKVDQ